MKLSRMQIRRLVEQVIKESDESKINKKDIGNALVAGPLYALLRKRQRKIRPDDDATYRGLVGLLPPAR